MQHSNANLETHARDAMGGLIMGINVIPDKRFQARISKNKTATRKLTLVIGEKENYFDNSNGKGFQLVEKGKARLRDRQATANGFSIPGPPLVLIRDQTVAIKIINTLKEPTTMHWHGLEIDSYYDGVPGWGYMGMKLAPLIQPGDSFTVYLTPSRAGTFMYHTHMHDLQLLQGMYADLFGKHKSLLNGTSTPEILYLKKRKRYRFRIINIGAQNFGNFISIKQNGQLVSWTLIGKDGISLRKNQRQLKPSSQRVAIGETFDFEFSPDKPGDYLIEVAFASKPEVTQLVKVEE
jgi:FtsP/CotA-like multicopper oxidase with cupredoxin domain